MKKITFSFVLLFSVLLPWKLSAQVATNYSFTQAAGTYTAITGGTVLVNGNGDMDEQVFGPITMPAFSFDGVMYTSLYVSTNGFITFGSIAPQTFYYEAISGTDGYTGAVAAFCEDLDQTTASGTKNIRYETIGNEFIVQWQNVSRYGLTGERISFQIRLNRSNNQVKIVYGGTIAPRASTDYPEVGLRGPDNTFATNVNNRRALAATGSWINSLPGTSNTDDMYFNNATNTTVPAVGLTYTWTPPAMDIMSAGVDFPLSGCLGSSNTVTVLLKNTGGTQINFAVTPLTINVTTTGPNPVTFPATVMNSGMVSVNAAFAPIIATGYDMSVSGNYTFTISTTLTGDAVTANNSSTGVIYSHTPAAVAPAPALICSGQSVVLNAAGTAFPYSTTFANSTPLAIPDNAPAGVNSTIVVTGLATLPAANVTVRVDNITHTYDGDLIIELIAPDGSSMLLSNMNGPGEMNFSQTLFTPIAVTPISLGTAPFTGSFLPDDPFTNLTGFSNGTWTLHVSDIASGDVGTLNGWTLIFEVPNSIVSYSWSPTTGLSQSNISNPVASQVVTTTYVVTVTDESGCTQSDDVVVTVNPTPTVNITGNTTICDGSSTTLTANGASTYAWSSGGTTDNETLSPSATTSYTVTGTDGNGCTDTSSATITVNALPAIAIAGNTTICNGSNTTLTATGAIMYSWSSGGTTNIESVAPTASTGYTVTGTDVNGCVNTNSVTVTVNALPSVAISGNTTICNGSSTTLTATGASTYSWSSGGTTDNETVSPVTATSYTVTGTDVNGCVNTNSVTVTVNALPTVAISGNTTICDGSSTTLTTTGASTYAWSSGGNTDNETVAPSTSTSYTVTGTDVNGCTNTNSVTVTVNAAPVVTFTLAMDTLCLNGGLFMLTGESPAGGTWSGTGVSGNMLDPQIPGVGTTQVAYTFTDGNGCSATNTQPVYIDNCSGIDEATTVTAAAWPNPTAGLFTVQLPASTGMSAFEVLDLQGKLVYSENAVLNNNQVDITHLANGTYFLKIITGNGELVTIKIVKSN